MAFRDVRKQAAPDPRGMVQAPQVADLGGGKLYATGAPGSVGDTSPNFYDDPTVNSVVKLPSKQQAEEYTGAHPSFYGVQRPGDWQRLVQRQMAEDVVGKETLNRAGDARVRRAQFGMPS